MENYSSGSVLHFQKSLRMHSSNEIHQKTVQCLLSNSEITCYKLNPSMPARKVMGKMSQDNNISKNQANASIFSHISVA